MTKQTKCERCGWPLDPAAARGGHRRHPGCDPTAEPDVPMLDLPATDQPTDPKEER